MDMLHRNVKARNIVLDFGMFFLTNRNYFCL